MLSLLRYAGQIAFFALAAVITGYFASAPSYRQLAPDLAQIKLSFAHGAARVEDCRRFTAEEIAALPPSERRPNTCARERVTVHVQLEIDGEIVLDRELEPTGLSRDGPARIYEKFELPAGRHAIAARLRDSRRDEGFDYQANHVVDLGPLQNLAIDFKADKGGFEFR